MGVLALSLLLGLSCSEGSAGKTPPEPSTSPSATREDAVSSFCGHLLNLEQAMSDSVALGGPGATQENVTDVVASLRASVGAIQSDAELFSRAGDFDKAGQLEVLADTIEAQADGFQSILDGTYESGGSSMVGPLEGALEGIDCSSS